MTTTVSSIVADKLGANSPCAAVTIERLTELVSLIGDRAAQPLLIQATDLDRQAAALRSKAAKMKHKAEVRAIASLDGDAVLKAALGGEVWAALLAQHTDEEPRRQRRKASAEVAEAAPFPALVEAPAVTLAPAPVELEVTQEEAPSPAPVVAHAPTPERKFSLFGGSR